jgi:RsmE family RNA methyltransferase
VNLLLVEAGELDADLVVLADRRAVHLRTVLGAAVGARVKVGLIGGATGTGEVISDDGTAITLRLALTEPAPEPLPVELVLAVPRPKVLTRTIESIAAFGVESIALTNAWRVDKSYLMSPRLEPAALEYAVRFGAEQGATTHLAPVTLHRRLMELLDTRWPEGARTRRCLLIAHPGGKPIENAVTDEPITLAIGPEGGWIEREVETFAARGFTPVALGTAILRVEAAVAAALGQLVLLRRLAER